MGTRDPELERQRLRAFYASLSDGELEKLVADEESLTDEARQVLKYELALRMLNHTDLREALPHATTGSPVKSGVSPQRHLFQQPECEEDDDMDEDADDFAGPVLPDSISALVTIRQFRDLPEALLAKGGFELGGN